MHAHDAFAEFYAVVLEHPAGGPLLVAKSLSMLMAESAGRLSNSSLGSSMTRPTNPLFHPRRAR